MNITRDDPKQVTPIPWPRAGVWTDTFSLLTTDSAALVLSALRRSANGFIARYYNITRDPVSTTITSGVPLKAAYRTDMAEQREADLPLTDGRHITADVRGGQVITLEFVPVDE
jgi:alpha-mannosidase